MNFLEIVDNCPVSPKGEMSLCLTKNDYASAALMHT